MNALTAQEMQTADLRTVEDVGIPQLLLMESAGRAVADRARDLFYDVDFLDDVRTPPRHGDLKRGAVSDGEHDRRDRGDHTLRRVVGAEQCVRACRSQADRAHGSLANAGEGLGQDGGQRLLGLGDAAGQLVFPFGVRHR